MPVRSATDTANLAAGESLAGVSDFALTIWHKIPFIIAAVVVLALAIVTAKFARRAAEKAFLKNSTSTDALALVGKTAFLSTLFLGVWLALNIVGIDLSLIVGALGFGLGFAVKDIVFNYFAGAFILVQKPFNVGDLVRIGETWGTIGAIDSRTTTIKTFDGNDLVVPNADVFNGQILNVTATPTRRVALPIGVDYSTDLELAERVVVEILAADDRILTEPKPAMIFEDFGDSSIAGEARFWIDSRSNYFAIRSDIVKKITTAFREYGITIPFPIRTIVPYQDTLADSDKVAKTHAFDESSGSLLDQKARWVGEITKNADTARTKKTAAAERLGKFRSDDAVEKSTAPRAESVPAPEPKKPAAPGPVGDDFA